MASLETRLALVERLLSDLLELVNGGERVRFNDSLRGKVHAMRQELDAANYARQALAEVRQETGRRWSHWERRTALAIAAVGVASPYLLHALGWH